MFFWDKNKQNKHLNRIDHLRVLKKCDVCGRMLGDSKSLRRHIVAKHTSANKSECYLCKKQFAMDYLRRHMINVHCTGNFALLFLFNAVNLALAISFVKSAAPKGVLQTCRKSRCRSPFFKRNSKATVEVRPKYRVKMPLIIRKYCSDLVYF